MMVNHSAWFQATDRGYLKRSKGQRDELCRALVVEPGAGARRLPGRAGEGERACWGQAAGLNYFTARGTAGAELPWQRSSDQRGEEEGREMGCSCRAAAQGRAGQGNGHVRERRADGGDETTRHGRAARSCTRDRPISTA